MGKIHCTFSHEPNICVDTAMILTALQQDKTDPDKRMGQPKSWLQNFLQTAYITEDTARLKEDFAVLDALFSDVADAARQIPEELLSYYFTSADPSQLAGSISVALLTTFWGLIISIIALPAFFFLKKHAQKLESECVNTVAEMMNTSINVINAEAQLARIPEGLNAEEGEEGEGELIEGQEA